MSINAKLVLPVALGLSLVTVTAVVVYYVFKKDEEESGDRAIKTSRVNVIEVTVPKSIVPALIGRSGSNIKEIEKKSGALIHFKKFSDKEYDVCIIRGRSEATQIAETMIHDFIKQQPLIVEDTITVPAWACGRIIGTGGENITDISHRSGARVKIENSAVGDKATERSISFRGTKEQIALAKDLVETTVAQEKCRREIEQSRSPRHVQVPSASPSPSPVSDHSEEPPSQGDLTTRHVRYKRPETVGAPIEVYVSAVSSPNRFWVQFVGPQVAQLDELVAHMTEYYGNKENRAAHAMSGVSVGQVVAAVFRHDGRWYRARVHDIRPNEFDATQEVADVFYLDYGDSEYVATHELCELRADLLRLRFQAMECFLAGVRPAIQEDGEPAQAQGVEQAQAQGVEQVQGVAQAQAQGAARPDKWHPQAIERFEELTQVARWKALVSRTCTYKKIPTIEGEKEKEIPGIKLYDVTDEGELDIGGALISEGWAVAGAGSPRPSPPPPAVPQTPFGDLGNSKVLSMFEDLMGGARSSSLPKDHRDEHNHDSLAVEQDDRLTASKSLASGIETDKPVSISNFDLTVPDKRKTKLHLNGSHDDFLQHERQHVDREGSGDTLTPTPGSPIVSKFPRDELKANMNRIDSHHNLDSLSRSQQDLHK